MEDLQAQIKVQLGDLIHMKGELDQLRYQLSAGDHWRSFSFVDLKMINGALFRFAQFLLYTCIYLLLAGGKRVTPFLQDLEQKNKGM